MNKRPDPNTAWRGCRNGISLVEVLVALGLITVLLAFASPSFGRAAARADLQVATEKLELGIRMGRNAARQNEIPIVMHVPTATEPGTHLITYSTPSHSEAVPTLSEFQFPDSVRILASAPEIRFNHVGLVSEPVHLELVSVKNERLRQHVVVE